MASDKSLAAEIEAVLRANTCELGQAVEADRFLIVDVKKAAAEIAALQSRAFEDGARKGLSEALAGYDAAVRKKETAAAVYGEVLSREGDMPDIGEIMDRIGAEGACMRARTAEKIAQTKLIDAVRAALAPNTTEGRTDRG